jgi:uncharacterized protein YaaW (UPF0174 family)
LSSTGWRLAAGGWRLAAQWCRRCGSKPRHYQRYGRRESSNFRPAKQGFDGVKMANQVADLQSGEILPVLRRAGHEDLKPIVEALDKSWDVRIKADARYQAAQHDLTAITEVIADYVTRAGGNAFRNLLRSGGPAYSEVLRDVCGVMKVNVSNGMGILPMEEKLLRDILERIWDKLTPEERKKIFEDVAGSSGLAEQIPNMPGNMLWLMPLPALLAQIGLRAAGVFLPKLGLQMFGAVLGPIGLAVAAALAVVDAVGPSYRGLVPAVFHIAALRQRFLWQDDEGTEAA